jgi:serine protease
LPLDGLRAGRYVLVHRVNGERRLRELSYANNAASLLLDLRWRRGKPLLTVVAVCPDTERCGRTKAGTDPIGVRRAALKARAADVFIPNDAGITSEPGGWMDLQWNFNGPFGVDAPNAWANLIKTRRPGAAGVVVAVLDTGVAYSDRAPFRRSPDLGVTRFRPGYDFVDKDPYPFDLNGHGTHVASTIAEQTDNAYGLTGLAYGAQILPVRVLDQNGDGYPIPIARGIRFAANHGARVINLSFNFAPSVRARQIPQVVKAIAYAHRRGSLVVAAAGNEGLDTFDYPALAPHVLSVGATTESGCLAGYSNSGDGIDLVAPGGGRDAGLPGDPACEAGRLGRPIYQITIRGPKVSDFGIVDDYIGTSMATAHVSAAAALVIASGVVGAAPKPAAVQRRLERTSRDLGLPGYDARYGWGLVNAGIATSRGPVSRRRQGS